jgi:hypothetical protein
VGRSDREPTPTPPTRVPYGPRRPSALEVVVWVVVISIALLPLAAVVLVLFLGTEDVEDMVPR